MLPRSIRSATAAWLVLLLGVLQTGLPSHSHDVEAPESPSGQVLRADHHAHGVTLVEQLERVQSTPLQLPVPAAAVRGAAFRPHLCASTAVHSTPLRPLGRAPPPAHASRAPPQHS
jgi:hypothetical protein